MTTRHSTHSTRPASQVARPAAIAEHPIWLSVLLHLAPGAALTAFVVAAYAVLGVDPLIGLLVGILVVLAPLELGYLAIYAHRNRGTWSPLAATDYRERLPIKRLLLTGLGLAAWMIVLVAFSFSVLDEWLADTVFRGHLLPRIERLGRGAPVLDTALFTLYHFHSPWRWPVIFLGFLPICTATWRRRSLWVGLAAHLIVNNVFVVMMLAGLLAA